MADFGLSGQGPDRLMGFPDRVITPEDGLLSGREFAMALAETEERFKDLLERLGK